MKGRNYPSSIGIGCQLLRDGCSPKAFSLRTCVEIFFSCYGVVYVKNFSKHFSPLDVCQIIVNGLASH
jgi:hypothetical protein